MSQRQRPSGADRGGGAARRPEPILAGERAREERDPRRAARSGGRERHHEGADRVAGGGVAGGGIAADRSDRGAPGGAHRRQARHERGAREPEPAGTGVGDLAERRADPLSEQVGSDDDGYESGQGERRPDVCAAAHDLIFGIPTDSSTPNVCRACPRGRLPLLTPRLPPVETSGRRKRSYAFCKAMLGAVAAGHPLTAEAEPAFSPREETPSTPAAPPASPPGCARAR